MIHIDNRELENSIEELQRKIRLNIEDLNYGGCGVFAALFSEHLHNLNIPHEILAYDWNLKPNTFIEKINGIRNNTNKSLSCSHVAIKISSHVIDGYKFMGSERNPIGVYDLESLKIALKNRKDWNRDYSRQQNRKLKSLIKTFNICPK